MRKLLANNGQPLPPEARLPLCIIGGVSLPVGLFWFAWTVSPAIHWSVCIIGSAPFGASSSPRHCDAELSAELEASLGFGMVQLIN